MAGTAARVAIDPRLRARRVAVKRSAGRRRLRRLVTAAVTVAVLVALIGLTRTPLLDVDRVVVTGSPNTPTADVEAVLGVELGDPMTDLDLRAASERVEELPWVGRAEVLRDWPNGVAVRIVERRPAAVVRAATDQWFLLDAEGRVLGETVKPQGPGEVPALLVNTVDPAAVVPGRTLPGVERPLRVAAAMTPDLAAWVEGVVPTDDGVDLALAGGATAFLGDEADYAEELRSLATVLLRVDLSCLATIDVSAHANPVVTRRC
ncbi:MAG: FtsQ-type POTRA domain-containing protein [Acidimicrobiales bacterium]|jgi:cell division protein FtsQ|nr:FtsQ-type POTRA domain-containing protein [Acidimicrobiales bacterium]